ncbi:MAG: amidohydrolase family protein [Acidobacteria bacterium]|nr:amidohydrolase family protein [Acidobacteriota bacterium]
MTDTVRRSCGAALLAVLFLASGVGWAQSTSEMAQKLERLRAYPDLIVVNGRIATLDAQLREVQAMAVRDHRILALGTNDEMRFLAGPRTEILDAKGRRVLPGLIDSHTHPHMWGVEHWLGGEGDFTAKKYNDPQLQIFYATGNDATEILRNLERIVLERARVLGPGKWIWTSLFGGRSIPESRKIVHPLFAQQGGRASTITQELLDTLAPDNPLLVFSSEAIGPEAHNTRAKEEMIRLLGYEANGLNARTAVLYDILMQGRTEEKVDFLKRELLQCVVRQGITTFANHYYGSPSIMQIYNLLYQREELPVRWAWFLGTLWGNQVGISAGDRIADSGDMHFFYRNLGDFRGIGNDYIWNAGVSNEAWETGLTCTKAKPFRPIDLSQVFLASDNRPDCSVPIDYEKQGGYWNVRAALESGLRIGFLHAYSDGTFDALLHLIEQAIAEKKLSLEQVRALRLSTEHNPIIRPDQVQKMAYYNIRPGFNGYQVQGDIKGGFFLKAYGEQYMSWIAPMKSLANAGVHPVFNTDAHLYKVPYFAKDMDYPPQWDGNIWAFMEFFITRKMPHDGITYNPQERMDRMSLMKAATIWGAEQVLNEQNIGSLEVGKLADFIVLDKDYFTIPEDQIHTIDTLLTAVGGKVVYQSSQY